MMWLMQLEPRQLYWGGLVGALIMAIGGACSAWLIVKDRLARLSPAEREQWELDKVKRRNERLFINAVLQETRKLSHDIPKHLAIQHGFSSQPEQPVVVMSAKPPRRHKKTIRFDAALITRTEMWFHFDGARLPGGTSFWDLKNPSNHVLDNLQNAIQRSCRFYEDNEYNLFLRVGLRHALMGIPRFIAWASVIDNLPKTKPFAVAIGVNENNKLIIQDVTAWPHAMILGATNMGKSVLLKGLLITLLSRNKPSALQVVLIDLKRVELYEFRDLPHVLHHVDRPDDVSPVLKYLITEMYRRLDKFVGVCNDINGWNRQRPNQHLGRIILVVDELATITTDRALRSEAIAAIISLARLGRAAGIHLLLCTQTVSREVLPMDVLANIEGRICFSVRNSSASTLAVGNGSAVGLELQGRAVFVQGSQQIYLQAPFIGPKEIEEAIEKIKNGGVVVESTDEITDTDLLKLVLYNFGGNAAWEPLFEAVQHKLSAGKIQDCLRRNEFKPDQAAPVLELDANKYLLVPSFQYRGGRTPRQLVKIETDDLLPADNAALKTLAISLAPKKQAKNKKQQMTPDPAGDTHPLEDKNDRE